MTRLATVLARYNQGAGTSSAITNTATMLVGHQGASPTLVADGVSGGTSSVTTNTRTCSIEGCARPHRARGWCSTHWLRWSKTGTTDDPVIPTDDERFWARVQKTDTCWLWTGGRMGNYGSATVDGSTIRAHRYAYLTLVGPIPEGLVLDHLCRVTLCVNPAHLEPVTDRVNTRRGISQPADNARKTHCKQGHPFDVANTNVDPRGNRVCRACAREKSRRRREDPAYRASHNARRAARRLVAP